MDKIKKVLIEIIEENKIEDLRINLRYWNSVISDINETTDENELLKIAQENFGFDSLEQVLEKI